MLKIDLKTHTLYSDDSQVHKTFFFVSYWKNNDYVKSKMKIEMGGGSTSVKLH